MNLSADFADRYPHELSGGQRQRLGIARDSAPTAPDRVRRAGVGARRVDPLADSHLLLDLQEELELTYLFVAHDLSVVEHVSDVIAVMYLGKVVESAPTDRFFARTLHPYSEALLSAVPVPDPKVRRQRTVLAGDVPSPLAPPSGCRFHPLPAGRREVGDRGAAVTRGGATAPAGMSPSRMNADYVTGCRCPLPKQSRARRGGCLDIPNGER